MPKMVQTGLSLKSYKQIRKLALGGAVVFHFM